MTLEEELNRIADKIGESYETVVELYQESLAIYSRDGISPKKAEKVALHHLKGQHLAALRSKAKNFEGFFFAVTKPRNKNHFVYKNAMDKIDEYKTKYTDLWLEQAVADQVTNERGEPIFGPHNTTNNQGWMIGTVIKEVDMEMVAYGFFRYIEKDDTGREIDSPLKYTVIRFADIDAKPKVGRAYSLKATTNEVNADMFNVRAQQTDKMINKGSVDFSVMESMLLKKFPATPFIDVYVPDENGKVKMLDGQPFYITETTVVNIAISDRFDTDYIDFQSLHDDDVDENIILGVTKEHNTLFDGAVGYVVYRPYYKKANPEKGIEAAPSGEIIGFISDPAFGKAAGEMKTLGEDDFE